jgi:hypothetical protein
MANIRDVAEAWEKVFENIAGLTTSFAVELRDGFVARRDANEAFTGDGGPTEQVTETVRSGVDALRSAVNRLGEDLRGSDQKEGRAEGITREAEGAMKRTLEEMAGVFSDLAGRLRDGDVQADES